MRNTIKKFLKFFLPKIIFQKRREFVRTLSEMKYKKLTTQEIFSDIYRIGEWGKSQNSEQPFFSGSGSHNVSIVSDYIDSVHAFLKFFSTKPNVVDLGCGDFSIGSKIRPLCNQYIACDIVAPLIEFNKKKYQLLNVDFRVLNLISDKLPSADIVFIRQVLQHLSNTEIENIVPKLAQNFKYLILTEHLPVAENFTHNLDMYTGPDTRLRFNSGVVLTSPPFNLKVKSQKIMLKSPEIGGLIQTTIYELKV